VSTKAGGTELNVDLGLGMGSWSGWTCDLTEAYVRLNSGDMT